MPFKEVASRCKGLSLLVIGWIILIPVFFFLLLFFGDLLLSREEELGEELDKKGV